MPRIPLKPKGETRRLALNIVEDLTNPIVILPPLYMHINPNNFKEAFAKKINRYQTFDSFVEEYWGEELDTISCDGSTGAFMSENVGLTNIYKAYTTPYFKFQDILDIYKNNGSTYDEKGRVVKRGYIKMYFHPNTYYGFFETFEYVEDASIPFRYNFNFSFKVEKSYTGF